MTTRSGKCFVPMCRTGYKGATGKFSLFRAPHDENLLQIWQRKIPRGDRNLTSRDVVCERHFTSSEIIKEWNSGSISIPYKRPKLKHGAIPTIFPNCPSYLTTATVSKRRIIERHEIPSKRAKMEQLENLEPVDKTVEDPDVIKNPFKDLLDGNIPFQLPPFCNFTTYVNPKTLQLDGFTNFGIEDSTKEKKELVDHALVFMFSALHDSFVQPVAVYGVKGATKGEILAQIILKIIIEITKAGGNVRGIICDGATTNRKMWSILGISGQKNNLVNSFKNPCNDEPIYAFSDTPYLFKCVRNRMYNQPHLVTPFGKILWSYYEALYELDKKNPGNLRVCKKLSYDHINPTNFLKMRVKLATQIFSNSVADGLTIYKERNPSVIDDNVKPTIQFTKFMNSLFDVLNRKCYLDGIYNDSKDFDILQKGLQFLDEWEDLKVKGYITEREGLTSNTLEGLRVSIQSTIDLTTLLLSKGYKYVATAKINQDPLEVVY
ncbi:hypothetical protein Zmor_014467 [Zophobas morio]|uniref:THAP-type domain-containing protein n=1 Tax=Zophobas morio TaxID=2755281 RepID=A0AA38IK21_9CUCU|nr:hypothetical protein Zmor_014467 [Zophobas morio]